MAKGRSVKPPRSLKTPKQRSAFSKAYRQLRNEGKSSIYAKRIASAQARGKSRQQARGHRAKEHVERKRKEIEKTGLSSSQKQSIRKWHEANDAGIHDEPTKEDLVDLTGTFGYPWFQEFRKTKKDLHARWLAAGMPKILLSDAEWDEHLTRVYPPDVRWLYYH